MFKIAGWGPYWGWILLIDEGHIFNWGVINFIEGWLIGFLREEYFNSWGHILITEDMFLPVDGGFIESGEILLIEVGFIPGWCSTPNQLLVCSSFSRKNGHPLLICSSLSTNQIQLKVSLLLLRGTWFFFLPQADLSDLIEIGHIFLLGGNVLNGAGHIFC